VSLWRNIRKNWGAFSNFVPYKVGDGFRIWCGERALKSSFPEFYSVALKKEALVSDYMDLSSPYTL